MQSSTNKNKGKLFKVTKTLSSSITTAHVIVQNEITLILGKPALFSEPVEEELDTSPDPLAELRSLPNDNEEPRPDVDVEESEVCRP